MHYDHWLKEVPREIKQDTVWSLQVYRASLFLSDLCWYDTKIIQNQHYYSLANQLFRSVGSISANIAEGYSRHSCKEQARFYEIALGSTRESKDWYFKSRHILGEQIIVPRIKILKTITMLLLAMIKERRNAYTKRS